jgi:hypothetical protein
LLYRYLIGLPSFWFCAFHLLVQTYSCFWVHRKEYSQGLYGRKKRTILWRSCNCIFITKSFTQIVCETQQITKDKIEKESLRNKSVMQTADWSNGSKLGRELIVHYI